MANMNLAIKLTELNKFAELSNRITALKDQLDESADVIENLLCHCARVEAENDQLKHDLNELDLKYKRSEKSRALMRKKAYKK